MTKEEIAQNVQFLLLPQCFPHYGDKIFYPRVPHSDTQVPNPGQNDHGQDATGHNVHGHNVPGKIATI